MHAGAALLHQNRVRHMFPNMILHSSFGIQLCGEIMDWLCDTAMWFFSNTQLLILLCLHGTENDCNSKICNTLLYGYLCKVQALFNSFFLNGCFNYTANTVQIHTHKKRELTYR